jgi:hypothetical protein
MDNSTLAAIVVAAITGLLSAGAFKFYAFALKQKGEIQQQDQANKSMYRDDLISRVEKLESERSKHLEQIMQLVTGLSSLKVEMDYMRRDNEILKLKLDAIR